MEASTVPPPKDRPNDTSSTAPPTLCTAAKKATPEPANEDASTAAPYGETLGDESGSSLPSTVQAAPLELDSAPPLPVPGPDFWRPGDKARLAINKKMRDIEFFLQDGTLQMRDSNTHSVLTDRHKKPKKDLPDFDRKLLYHRVEPSSSTSQDLARGIRSSSKGSIGKDKVTDNGTSISLLRSDLFVMKTLYAEGTRRDTRRTAAQKKSEGERQLRTRVELRATDGKGGAAPKGR